MVAGAWALVAVSLWAAPPQTPPRPATAPAHQPRPATTPPAPAPAKVPGPAKLPGTTTAAPAAAAPAPAPAGQGVLPPFTPPPLDAGQRREWLRARFDELFGISALTGAKVSVLVSEPDTGKVVYARAEKTALNAASNVKIVTSAAALALLGPEFRWKTAVYGAARPGARALNPGGELPGDLYLRGAGDPTFSTRDLNELASELAALGLRKVRGALVVDATLFEGGAVGPAYDQKVESAAFRSPSSAASLNQNAILITISPSATAGGAARVVLDPPSPYFVVSGKVVTATRGPAVPLIETADAGNGQTRITLSGRIRLGSDPRYFLRRVVHPERFLGITFQQILLKRGITFDKPMRFEALPAGEGWRALASHDSPPLAVVVHDLNKRSSNFAAEQVIRTLGAEVVGRPGNWDKGLEAVARYLESVGVTRNTYKMVNGAGLYDSNRFSAEQISAVLRGAMRDFRIAGEFLASLAVAGADGTLAQRMAGTVAERYIRAKTGTLLNVSCLSGIAGAPGQKPVVFSILMNDVANPLEARAIQDRAAELLVSFLEPNRPTTTRIQGESR